MQSQNVFNTNNSIISYWTRRTSAQEIYNELLLNKTPWTCFALLFKFVFVTKYINRQRQNEIFFILFSFVDFLRLTPYRLLERKLKDP